MSSPPGQSADTLRYFVELAKVERTAAGATEPSSGRPCLASGVTEIFLEGRIDSERATHSLRSAKAEITALGDDWRVAKDMGRIIHPVKR